jgi:hypothetical protein
MKKYQQLIPLNPKEKIFIKAHATLDVEGWGNPELSIETDLNVQKIRREEEGLFLLFVDDAAVKVPEDADIVVQKANGNARIRNVSGDLAVNSVSGNLAVQQAGNVNISRISGNCLVQNLKGRLDIHGVGGNLKGKDCFGQVKADRISAGVELYSLHAGAEIRSMGDIHLSFLSESEQPVYLRSTASIYLNLPFELNAEMKVKSNAQLTELVIGDRKEKIHHRKHVLLVGEGKRKYELVAGGKVRVVAEQIEDNEIIKLFEELETLWEELGRERLARREAEKEDDGAEEEREFDVTQEEMKIAEERVQQALEQVENRLQSMGYDANQDSTITMEDQTQGNGDLTGERLIIMRLLGENKISIEDADKLLEALEGNM